MAGAVEPHLLALKVMRLSHPSYAQTHPLYTDTDLALPAAEVVQSLKHSDSSMQVDDDMYAGIAGLGSLLTLPPAFGNIYLGETFSSYLCVNNESLTPVLNLTFKAELQTSTQRITLADTLLSSASSSASSSTGVDRLALGSISGSYSTLHGSGPAENRQSLASSLLPGQSAEFVIHHDIKELGIHILVCSVHYTPAPVIGSSASSMDRERKFFRKFYKFQVLNPLSVKTKVNTLQDGRIFLEAQVQNVSSSFMYLEYMNFEPNDPFLVQDLNLFRDSSVSLTSGQNDIVSTKSETETDVQSSQTSKGLSVFKERDLLGQQDTRQYLYMLTPKSINDVATRMLPGLGKLDISWRTVLGQSGRLQTSQLSRKILSVNPFEVFVVEQPRIIRVEQPFVVKIRITNHVPSERLKLSIHGYKNKMTNVLLRGPNNIELNELEGASSVDVDLEFFALAIGLQKITGIQVSDKVSGTTRDIGSLTVVRVIS
ncbi:hypothetical protein BATDEDRAFT_34721 [Batrachochytrium dendrobatidis JAM81]|uniref:Trafficking protein particle complex subunit 13 n=2 Tax=Batrachochytrium dendrobatidis TaxID=109871 RepID=F4P095_BATDJ|nr:uncharacterized protein BATDEDRAFT_34721 [Batrachochytrium dendrobatidis JAM81]EGF81409.1 hypothetical protein BATDEDRAFT_34721 [Batrachochytrium dendrobatidis JAM81]KAJ8329914.1 hypothetical protein O5D80_002102 [Batrachochytrium dendrobatidis]KAK5669978.1 hypothetical protein QVD99_004350 [Batrachochytrium dendrobatidis]OAJ38551.1 hypothetical protein BDEG_22462 [Batrachochytrium dendrobatidis JEL423]|eukprot:XP_006677987.1 hypothetical protein BATDEDRAFT_34721 [Batrachochytrium dendrobatidis JAM81]